MRTSSVVASHTLPPGDLACNPGMCPDWELNQQPFGLQDSTQSTEPHQSGQNAFLISSEKVLIYFKGILGEWGILIYVYTQIFEERIPACI